MAGKVISHPLLIIIPILDFLNDCAKVPGNTRAEAVGCPQGELEIPALVMNYWGLFLENRELCIETRETSAQKFIHSLISLSKTDYNPQVRGGNSEPTLNRLRRSSVPM